MIMKAGIILHNMIIEDERDSYDLSFEYDDVEATSRNLMSNGTIIHAMQHIFVEYNKFRTETYMHVFNRLGRKNMEAAHSAKNIANVVVFCYLSILDDVIFFLIKIVERL